MHDLNSMATEEAPTSSNRSNILPPNTAPQGSNLLLTTSLPTSIPSSTICLRTTRRISIAFADPASSPISDLLDEEIDLWPTSDYAIDVWSELFAIEASSAPCLVGGHRCAIRPVSTSPHTWTILSGILLPTTCEIIQAGPAKWLADLVRR
ncbi:hypothetical protein BDZ45DRAFT_750364 [Acephala macrosclerotiorum]|nr:hypothetical protein BDZ45DRAFT_750364 [Acephala macrosclerotiorum]